MTMLLALAFLIPTLDQATAPPTTPPEGAPTAATRPGLDPNQVICRRYRESGSRIAIRRMCMTREQWVLFNGELRQNVDRAQLTRVIGGK